MTSITTSSSIVQTLSSIAEKAVAENEPKVISGILVYTAGSALTPIPLGTLSY